MECPFCNSNDAILRNDLAYACYDKYPVSKGHVLIIPIRHISNYFDLTKEEHNDIFLLVDDVKLTLDKLCKPDGYNVGFNVNKAAGQTIWHAHVHVIPRYKGDLVNPQGGVRGVIPDKQNYQE